MAAFLSKTGLKHIVDTVIGKTDISSIGDGTLKGAISALNTKVNGISANYPVGSIYLSVNSTNPSTLFGGTWTQIKDTFLLAAGSSYSAGATGGSKSQTISYQNLPARVVVSTKNIGSSAVTIGNVPWSATKMSANTWSCVSLADNVNKSYLSPNYGNGTQTAVNTMPPYLAVYVWKRTA